MTYFGFLSRFILLPVLLLAGLTIWRASRRSNQAENWRAIPLWKTLTLFVLIAVIYTTPWDNYLVANRVWWYDPRLVTGITFGWVPAEEYTFFILQTILTGLWLNLWMHSDLLRDGPEAFGKQIQKLAWPGVALVWVISTAFLFSGWRPATYLTLILSWGLLPVILQLVFGADILWRRRQLVLLGLLPTTLYLALADSFAIQAGTWTIDPDQTLGLLLGGVLPLEELVFFFITNLVLVLGIVLFLDPESENRLQRLVDLVAGWTGNRTGKGDPSGDAPI